VKSGPENKKTRENKSDFCNPADPAPFATGLIGMTLSNRYAYTF
jgi:hypothetical protein